MTAILTRLMAGLAGLVLLTGAAAAGSYEQAVAARDRGDYAAALRLLMPLAKAGNSDAELTIGNIYYQGQGVARDRAAAARWFAKAATHGSVAAEFNLGLMYQNGDGLPQDFGKSAKWYGKAAADNDADGQTNLALLYERGQGVPQDYGVAAMWLGRAAGTGNADAQYDLGFLYQQGQGVRQDNNEAAKWFGKSARQGLADAQYSLGALYDAGQGVPRDHTRAMQLYQAAAKQGYAPAQHELGAAGNPFAFFNDKLEVPAYTLRVSADGRALTLSGGIRFGLEQDLEAALDAAPHVRTIYLTSPGGRLGPATDVAQLIKRRGLDTFVPSECSSICTEIFVAGKHRTLARGARLGFHSASLAMAPEFVVWFIDQAMLKRYTASGVDRGFMERAIAVSPKSIWYPPVDQLLAAHVITAVADAGDLPGPSGSSRPMVGPPPAPPSPPVRR